VKKSGVPFVQEDYDNLEEPFDELVIEQEAQVFAPIFINGESILYFKIDC